MFNLFNRSRQSRVDRLEERFIGLAEQGTRTICQDNYCQLRIQESINAANHYYNSCTCH